MRRLILTLLAGAALNACGGEPPEEPAAAPAEAAHPASSLPGGRAIDRAQSAASAAADRALRHDTIR